MSEKTNSSYWLKTFGCQMNVADSERIDAFFRQNGMEKSDHWQNTDTLVLVSCMVRESAENRIYGLVNEIGKFFRKKKVKPPRIILTGCLAGWALRDKTGKNYRVLQEKTGGLVNIVLVENLADFGVKPEHFAKDMALVPISNGCNNFCSYCIVPYCRGREKSRDFNEIISEVENLVKNGYRQFLLLGQNVNSYGSDLAARLPVPKRSGGGQATEKAPEVKITFIKSMGRKRLPTLFPSLLAAVAKIRGVKKVDFMSSNPWDFSDDLIQVIANHKNITRVIHLPIQSGDDEILRKMNRAYTAKQYLSLLRKIRRSVPEAEFTTDIIVGFPGEKDKQFQNTVNLCQKAGFRRAFINRYSPRLGTAAAKMPDDVPVKVKKERWLVLEKMINANFRPKEKN